MMSIGGETALNGMDEAVAALVHIKKTVQVEFRTANSDEAAEAEVVGGPAEAPRGVPRDGRVFREVRRIAEARLVLLRAGKAARRVFPVLCQCFTIVAAPILLPRNERIEHNAGGRA